MCVCVCVCMCACGGGGGVYLQIAQCMFSVFTECYG